MSADAAARVSVIIPARDEELNIERVVRSVARERPAGEIIVVDDRSEDRTAQILARLAGEFPALRVLKLDALPEGWTGKNFALARGAGAAKGEWLLFSDADTEHRPGSLAALLERAEQEGAALLSLSPGQRTPTWWEKAVIPLVYVDLASLYRFEDVSNPASPVAAANGQYILIRREAYERVGGHEAVRGEILEDVALARRVKAAGLKVVFLPGAPWVETRMYASFGEMWAGWTKNLYLLYEGKLGRMALAAVRWLLAGAVPLALLVILSARLAFGQAGAATVVSAVACLLIAAAIQWRFGSAVAGLGHDAGVAGYLPLGSVLYSLLLANSARAHRLSKRVRWKGREYRVPPMEKR